MKQETNHPNAKAKTPHQNKDSEVEFIKANKLRLSALRIEWKKLGRLSSSNSIKSVEKIAQISKHYTELTKGTEEFFQKPATTQKTLDTMVNKVKPNTNQEPKEPKISPLIDIYSHLIKNTNLKTNKGKENIKEFLQSYLTDEKTVELMESIEKSRINSMTTTNPLLDEIKPATLMKLFILADIYYKVEIDLFGNNPTDLIKFEDLLNIIVNQDEDLNGPIDSIKAYQLNNFFSTLTVLICTDFSIRKIETSLRHFTRIFDNTCRATTASIKDCSAKCKRLASSLNSHTATKETLQDGFQKVKEFDREYGELVDRVFTILETKKTFIYNDVMKKNFVSVDYFSHFKSYCKAALEKMKNSRNKEDYVNKMISNCRKVAFLPLSKTPNYKSMIKVMYDQFLTSRNVKGLMESIKSKKYIMGMNIDRTGIQQHIRTEINNISEMELEDCFILRKKLIPELKKFCFGKIKIVSASLTELDCTTNKFYSSLPSMRFAMSAANHIGKFMSYKNKPQVDIFLKHYDINENQKSKGKSNEGESKDKYLRKYFKFLLTPAKNNSGIGFNMDELFGLKWLYTHFNFTLYLVRLNTGEFIIKYQNGKIKFLEISKLEDLKGLLSSDSNRIEGALDILYYLENINKTHTSEPEGEGKDVTIVHSEGESMSKLRSLIEKEVHDVARGFISNLIVKHEDIVNNKDTDATNRELTLKGFQCCNECQETTETEVAIHCLNCHQTVLHGDTALPLDIKIFDMANKRDLFINYPYLFKDPENLLLEDNYMQLLCKRTDNNYIYCEKYIKHLNGCIDLKHEVKELFKRTQGDKIATSSQLKAYKTEHLVNLFRSKNLSKTLHSLFKDNLKDYFYMRLIKYVLLDMDFCLDMNFFTERSNLNTDRKRNNWIDRLKYSTKNKQLVMASKEFCYSISGSFFRQGFNFNKLRTDLKKQLLAGLDYFDKTVCYDKFLYKIYYKKDLDLNQVVFKPAIGNDNLITENDACEKCRGRDNINKMLLCDGCELAYHMYCLELEVDLAPLGKWYCPECCRPLGSHGLMDPAFFTLRRKRQTESYKPEDTEEEEEEDKPKVKKAKKMTNKKLDLADDEEDSFLDSDVEIGDTEEDSSVSLDEDDEE